MYYGFPLLIADFFDWLANLADNPTGVIHQNIDPPAGA